MSEPITIRQKPLTFEAMRFPNGGKTQHTVAEWVESHGAEMPLWDGNVERLETPADDGSSWRWCWAIIRDPNRANKNQEVMFGDYIIHLGDGNFRVVKPYDFDQSYEEVDDA